MEKINLSPAIPPLFLQKSFIYNTIDFNLNTKTYQRNPNVTANLVPIRELLERIEKKIDWVFKNQFLSINEVSNLTSLSASTIRRAIDRGELKCSKKLGKLLFQESDLMKWLNG